MPKSHSITLADPVLDRLLDRLDETADRAQNLIRAAALVSGNVATIATGRTGSEIADIGVMDFLHEEAESTAGRVRDIYDELVRHLRKTLPAGEKPHG